MRRTWERQMDNPEHFFIVKRFVDDESPWEYLQGDFATIVDCRNAILCSFNGGEIEPDTETVLVLEIDGHVAMNRTEDALAGMVVTPSSVQRYEGGVWQLVSVCSIFPAENMPKRMHRGEWAVAA